MHDDWGRFLSVNAGCFSPPHTPELAPPSPFALRPNKAYRLNPDLVDPEPQSPPAADSKDSIPTRLYRRPSVRRKKKTNDYYAAIRVLSIRVSIHQKPHPSSVHRHYTATLRQRPSPKHTTHTNTRLHSPYTETRLRVHHPPTLHQTRLQTDFSEK